MYTHTKKFNIPNRLYFVKGGLYDTKRYCVSTIVGRYNPYRVDEFNTKAERKEFVEEMKLAFDSKPKFSKFVSYGNSLTREYISVKG